MVVGAETLLVTKIEMKVNTQSGSGGKVNILGGESIRHCGGKKVHTKEGLVLIVTETGLLESTDVK
jgi:hypothetical protein